MSRVTRLTTMAQAMCPMSTHSLLGSTELIEKGFAAIDRHSCDSTM
jgi:hypothetical protein